IEGATIEVITAAIIIPLAPIIATKTTGSLHAIISISLTDAIKGGIKVAMCRGNPTTRDLSILHLFHTTHLFGLAVCLTLSTNSAVIHYTTCLAVEGCQVINIIFIFYFTASDSEFENRACVLSR
ncbi:MAG TPA: hypothetical protein VE971_03655, partial [Candidatus Eisenbacteria bacterium]|nr:hypothetical protein [Candidatus Eisenbacteria bacterium]